MFGYKSYKNKAFLAKCGSRLKCSRASFSRDRPGNCQLFSAKHSISGFTYGFSIQCSLSQSCLQSPNLKSALQNPAAVNAKLAKELAMGHTAGPLGVPPFPDFMISPLGLVPKRMPSEFCLIHHLSFPCSSFCSDEHYVFATITNELPVTAAEIAGRTKKDSLLVKIHEYTSSGWPGSCLSPELRPFWNRRDEFSLENGCLLWGSHVIIPFNNSKNIYWKSYTSAI